MMDRVKAMLHQYIADTIGIIDDVTGHFFYSLCNSTEHHMDRAHELHYNGDRCLYDACKDCGKNVELLEE